MLAWRVRQMPRIAKRQGGLRYEISDLHEGGWLPDRAAWESRPLAIAFFENWFGPLLAWRDCLVPLDLC